MTYTIHYDSSLGGILLSADEIGLTGLWFDGAKYFAKNLPETRAERQTSVLSEAARWLDIYFSGREPDFTPPLNPIGSPFRKAVWKLILEIPYGKTATYGALAKEIGGKILLVGVGHERNTYIHSAEEVLNVPNRLSAAPTAMQIVPEGKKPLTVYMRRHYNPQQPHISEDFVKLNRAFEECGAAVHTVFGSADCILCDARRIFEVTRHVLAPDPECLVTGGEIPPERWAELLP